MEQVLYVYHIDVADLVHRVCLLFGEKILRLYCNLCRLVTILLIHCSRLLLLLASV